LSSLSSQSFATGRENGMETSRHTCISTTQYFRFFNFSAAIKSLLFFRVKKLLYPDIPEPKLAGEWKSKVSHQF